MRQGAGNPMFRAAIQGYQKNLTSGETRPNSCESELNMLAMLYLSTCPHEVDSNHSETDFLNPCSATPRKRHQGLQL